MAAIDDLLNRIEDEELRTRIIKEVKGLQKNKKFGLVFEEHLPECTPLYDVPVKVGKTVALKNGSINDNYTVLDINADVAICIKKGADEQPVEIPVNDLVVVAIFGEPIYPYLKPIDSVCNAPDSNLWHTLIEADNYHALQLLDYLYHGKVDCIYIDPPYNTGAKDWKYNNNYVDENDAYRHSKWLSMMEKRLRLAKRLLASDGAMITTIDDNEYSHLQILINEIFPEALSQVISIQMNPGGTQGKAFSVTNEYAIITYFKDTAVFKKQHSGGDTYNLRRWGSTSNRYEGATCFYPIILDSENNVIGFGDVLPDELHPNAQVEVQDDGTKFVWPLDVHGTEKKWRYARATVEDVKSRIFIVENGSRVEVMLRRETEPPKTMWIGTEYSAETYGTKLIKDIIGKGRFSYPKSVYATKDCLAMFVAGKPDSLILDFFAGSGTTLHAVNLLNAEDGGHRRCIMVTNNEVAEVEANSLKEMGYQPGEEEWEKLGIARYVTWPRTKCSIQGIDVNGEPLSGEYFTNLRKSVEYPRTIKQIALNSSILNTAARKSIVALIGKDNLPQRLVTSDCHYIISEKYTTSIIFDLEYIDEYIDELNTKDHVTDVYIVTNSNTAFRKIKKEVSEVLGPIAKLESVSVPMADGFKTNCAYFKLGFLDKTAVKIGRQFREILPMLWMKAGSVGVCPNLDSNNIPEMLILPENHFAVLVKESYFAEFKEKIEQYSEIDYVYIVTDYEDGYRAKISNLNVKNIFRLYSDYLDNFDINYRRN